MKIGLASIAFAAFVGITGAASAATCVGAGTFGVDISSRVNADGATTNSGCQVGTTSTPHAPDPQTRANADLMFGFSDWVIHPSGNAFLSPDAASGSYTLPAGFFTTYDRALLLFQSEFPFLSTPQNYVGYLLLAANGTTGTWSSPFDFLGYPIDVAHIKLLYHLAPTGGPGPSPVPLPAPFLLLGLALGGLGVGRWWKNRRAPQAA
jgi:hypothetical protein